ncbi:MAG: hypothetical protein ING19_17305 [Azospirillum sp.]|nr:hypothetical protein [Azospirillum sp.]
MTGRNPFSKPRDKMPSERRIANAAAGRKKTAKAETFGSWLVANGGSLPEDFEIDV